MKKYSFYSSVLFIILTITFYKIPREEEVLKVYNKEIINKDFSTSWLLKTSKTDFVSPVQITENKNKEIIVGKSIWTKDYVYLKHKLDYEEEKVFLKGITSNDTSFILIATLMMLQFFILIGLNKVKEHLFLNAYCAFLMVIQFLYLLRVWLF